ncbi:hypothetical protein ASG69_20530 [Rhodococcus sp. Leaf225]|nr:hypothetical protein ASG69_20530 [Rhodococcus sp. Leaf225]KQU47977.1 hypothetical protein ASH03_20735 [Rhodococcus sp. Leaf258]
MSASVEIGITTFAETYPEEGVREVRGHGRRLREVVEEAQLADEVGLDVYGVGEHHREDFAASAPAVVLAAIAARTERIRLTHQRRHAAPRDGAALHRTSGPRGRASGPRGDGVLDATRECALVKVECWHSRV